MKLTDQQKQGIRTLYGDNSTGATSAIQKVESKKGKFKFFNEDGSVNVSIEDFEKKINKESKPTVKKTSDEVAESIIEHFKEAQKEVKNLKNLQSYKNIIKALKDVNEELKTRKEELRDSEVKRLREEIAERENRIKELTTEKITDKAGEPRNDISVELIEETK